MRGKQLPAPVFFCTHARKACINGLLSASRGKEPTADVKTVCPGSRSRCPQRRHESRDRDMCVCKCCTLCCPMHRRLTCKHIHTYIVGHERTQPGHQTRESVRRAPPVRSHAGPLIGLRHPPDNADCVTRTRPRSHHSLPHPPDNADCVTRTRPRSHHSLPSSLAHDHPFAYASTIFLRTSFFSRRTVSYKSLKVLAVPSL
jgi:hypothetical protein